MLAVLAAALFWLLQADSVAGRLAWWRSAWEMFSSRPLAGFGHEITLLRRYLTQEGFEVLLAEDSKSLNRLLTRENIDLIVLDLMMPGEDGLSICRRLRAANDVTPIIMLTAKVEDVDRIVGLEVGADD